ncbi:MAG: hypothetical protein J3R72DRAFT_422503 [Linnemannia gamsii]|nr:MAG: hypothetical protein J3R72DRAFT_422503 [Linnemannia gamsii]
MSSQPQPPSPPSTPAAKPSVSHKRPRDTESDAKNTPPLPENNTIQASKKNKSSPPRPLLPLPVTPSKLRLAQAKKQKQRFTPLSSLPSTSRSVPSPIPHAPPTSIPPKQPGSLPMISESEVMGPPRLPVRRQHQKRPPAVQPPEQQHPDLTDLKKILERNKGKYFPDDRAVFIPISDSSVATKLYSFLTASTGVQDLQIALNWQWARQDVDKLEEAVRQCRVSCLKVDGCYYRTLFCADGSHKARFRPLIQLLGCKTLTQVYFTNMAEYLEDVDFNPPDDLSHLRVLQIHVEFTDWGGVIAQRFCDLLGRLTHLERLVIDCPKDHFRDYLENTLYAFSLQSYAAAAATTTVTSTTPSTIPSADIVEVQLFHEGRAHVVAHFKRQGVVPISLRVDLGRALGYEVNWKPILDSPMAQSINNFQLLNARRDDWLVTVRKWLGTRQEQNQLQQPISLSTAASDDNATTTTCTTTSARLLRITLDCRDITSARELAFIRLLGNAISPDLQLKNLYLLNLHLPLPPPSLPEVFSSTREVMQYEEEKREGIGSPDSSSFKKKSCNGWSTLFMGGSLHNLEKFEVTGCNFGDDDVEGFVYFAKKMKMMSDQAEKKLHMKIGSTSVSR